MLPPLAGHGETRRMLARGFGKGELPHSILFAGPPGAGKERLALWTAQLLVCDRPTAEGPCEECAPCRRTRQLEHPDVHWFFPLPRPEGAGGEKLGERLEELRGEELARRRAEPLRPAAFDRPPAHFLAQVQTLCRLAANRPSMARRKVFVVGDAELMVPQEASPEAANAFLKLLEEPPPDTHLLLTSSRPGALLPTVLSRVLELRVRLLASGEVESFLVSEAGVRPEEAAALARRAAGAPGAALALLAAGGAGALEEQRERTRAWVLSLADPRGSARHAAALALPSSGARGEFVELLDAFAGWLRDLMAICAGEPGAALHPESAAVARELTSRLALRPETLAASLLHVAQAREDTARNVNPQLALAQLLLLARRELLAGHAGCAEESRHVVAEA